MFVGMMEFWFMKLKGRAGNVVFETFRRKIDLRLARPLAVHVLISRILVFLSDGSIGQNLIRGDGE